MRGRPRRRRSSYGTVSLISFVDLIAGLIGALSLIIISLSLINVAPESSSASLVNYYKQLSGTQIQQKTAQINSIRKTISGLDGQQKGLQQASLQLETLQQNINRTTDQQGNIAEALKEKQGLYERIRELDIEVSQLRADIAELDTRAAEKKGGTPRDKIEVHFTGRGRGLKPTFVECTAGGLVIRDGEMKETINNRIISTSDKFHQLLELVKKRTGGTIIFLVRPDGIRSFNLALARAEQYSVRSGKLPLAGSGEIDLGHYKE